LLECHPKSSIPGPGTKLNPVRNPLYSLKGKGQQLSFLLGRIASMKTYTSALVATKLARLANAAMGGWGVVQIEMLRHLPFS